MATKKQKAAARRNIKKAQAALRKKQRGHTKHVRRAHKTAHAHHPKKRRVSKKQRAAARRNIKKAQAGKRKRKACRRAAGRRGAAKRAGKRMPKMPKRCAPKKHHAGTHRKRRKSSSSKRRKRSKRHDTQTGFKTLPGMGSFFEENPVRRKHRKHRRHNPHRRHHSHHRHHRHHNPLGFAPLGFLANPVRGFMHVGTMIFGLGVGYVATDLIDRTVATHPVVAAGAGFTDTPGANQIYDSEAPLLPLWSDPKRLAVNGALIFLPWAVAKFVVRGAKGKAFLHTAALGSFARLGGKLIGDTVAYAAKPGNALQSNMWANRLYSPEIAAQQRLDQVAASGLAPLMASSPGTSATQPSGQFAGLPKNQALPPKKGVGDPDPGPDPDICTTSEMTKEVNNAVNANPTDNSHSIVAEHSLPFNPLDPTGEGCDCLPFVPMPALSSAPPSPVSLPGAPSNYMPPGAASGGYTPPPPPPAPPPPATPAPHAYFPR